MANTSDIRLKLAEIVHRAENDDAFRQRLASDRAGVLAEHGIPANAVEEFSKSIQEARVAGNDPTGCIHTSGCRDFTCFSSSCGNSCFVSVVIDAPDA